MAVSIEQAAANALAAYLTAQLAGVTCKAFWPNASQKLPPKAVTVVPVGRRRTVDHLGDFIRVVSFEDRPLTDDNGDPLLDDSGNQLTDRIYTYAVSPIEQPFQLDVWATTDFDRDDIVARLDDALTLGLGITLGATNADPFRDGVLLALGDGFTGNADFFFDGPTKDDNVNAAGRAEFRATYSGTMTANRTQTVRLPILRAVKLKLRVGEIITADTDTYTILTSGDLSWTIP
jgi:hypothetical protein